MVATASAPRRASSTTRTEAISAPLPPNQRWRRSQAGSASRSSSAIESSSEEVVETLLGPLEAQDRPERRRLLRRQPHERGASLPERALPREHVVDLVRLVVGDAEELDGDVQDRLLRRVRIEADRGEDQAGAVIGGLGVEGHALVVGAVEAQVAVRLQRLVLAARAIERGDPGLDVAGLVQLPGHQLVLLRVGVLLLARQGVVLAEFEAAVDSPRRAERRSQRGPDQERRPPA